MAESYGPLQNLALMQLYVNIHFENSEDFFMVIAHASSKPIMHLFDHSMTNKKKLSSLLFETIELRL
jgi:hypothetical protein